MALRSKKPWSEDQKITEIDEDTIRLTFSCSSDVEIVPWVLSFGSAVKVIQPEWLKEEIMNISKRTADLYEN